MWRFDSYGPFEAPRFDLEEPRSQWRARFWEGVSTKSNVNLGSAIGCYVFCLSRGSKAKPWYVGKTVNREGFSGECLEPHKLSHHSTLMEAKRTHTPALMLFPLLTEGWGLSYAYSHGDAAIDWLETLLIGMAIRANPTISNVSKTRFHREVYVHGLVGRQFQGRPSNGAGFAKRLFRPT